MQTLMSNSKMCFVAVLEKKTADEFPQEKQRSIVRRSATKALLAHINSHLREIPASALENTA